MISPETAELVKRRMLRARSLLDAAKNNFRLSDYNTALNRAYYAAFYGMRALLAVDNIDKKHHSGVISEFRRLYIKTGIFPIEYSRYITVLFESRTDSDYDDYFESTETECNLAISYAENLIHGIFAYLESKMPSVVHD